MAQLAIRYNVLGEQITMIFPKTHRTDFSSVWSIINTLHADIEYLIYAEQSSNEVLEATQATDRHDTRATLFLAYGKNGYEIVVEFEEDTPHYVVIRLLSHELAEYVATVAREVYQRADQL